MDIWQQFGIITDASTIDASEQIENIPADILHAIEQTLMAEAKALQRKKFRKSVALVRYEDFFEFEKPFAFGEYFFENDDRQAMIALNDTFIANEDLLTAVFWHEYAHHIYYEWRLELSIKMEELIGIAQQTQTWTKLEALNKRENTTYWTDKEEVWARAASQVFMYLAGENEALQAISLQMPTWDREEFSSIAKAVVEVLRGNGAYFTFAQEYFAPSA